MAELTLNTTTSIVDYLKSQGKASDYSSREALYNSTGLADRLGTYTGSSTQNTAFLKSLQTPTQTGAITPTTTTPTQTGTTLPSGVITTASQTPTAPETPAPTPTPTPTGSSGITATQALSSIPGMPSADEILNNVLNSSKFQNFQNQQNVATQLATGTAESQKAKLEADAKSDTQAFINSIGKRGLFFSGETGTGLQALAESLASSKLNIDRKLAGDLLQSDLKTKEEIINEVGALVKEAQKGRKEAIDALEKVGLTVIGDQVVPTLAAQREDRQVQAEERLAQTAAFNQAATLERLDFAQQSAQRAEAYLQLAEERAANSSDPTKITLSDSDKASVTLYGHVLDQEVQNGATPQEALQVALGVAAAQGNTLTTTNQVALLDYASKLSAEAAKKIEQDQTLNSMGSFLFSPTGTSTLNFGSFSGSTPSSI